jgi:hypothetical protein
VTAPRYPIFEISPLEFEKLCLELLQAEGGSYSLGKQSAYDIEGMRLHAQGGEEKIAIEVKHRSHFQMQDLKKSISKIQTVSEKIDTFIYITSAPISAKQQQETNQKLIDNPSDLQIKVLGQQDLYALLSKHRKIADKYFKTATAKKNKRFFWLTSSTVMVVFSALSLVSTTWKEMMNHETTTFEDRIDAVEKNLRGLKSLEESLKDLKAELQEKSAESARIKLEYEEALKLQSFTEEEIDRFKKAASATSPTDTFLNYLYGFILGVFGSILATIITDQWKVRRALNRS